MAELAPNTGYGMLNTGTTLPKPAAPLPPNTGYGMLNPGTTLPPPSYGPTLPPGTTQSDILGNLPNAADLVGSNGLAMPGGPSFNFNADTDPGVLAAIANEQQGFGTLDAALKAARERAIVNYGDPSIATDAGFGVDPETAAFARQNYQSGNAVLARLAHAHELNRQAIINRLAAHGILASGDLGYQEGQENQSYGNTTYDAKQQLLDSLANLLSNYNSQRQDLANQVLQARMNAINNFVANPDAYAAAYGS